ncbi:hypothetical protein BC941DRAFT_446620 [Chlamydoabsidia padenii]|nr:hypothetical protein BC941DRAFT_446620 [Chlamydoabsidia padenii]
MPPNKKPINKKVKPLTSLERRAKKKKQELIHKMSVKSQYYKSLAKEHGDDDTPDYVKQIFEKTIDEDGNVVEYESGTTKRKTPEKEEPVYDLDQQESSSSDDDDDDSEPKSKKQKKDDTKTHKPNPFKAQLEEQQKRKRLTEEERLAKQQEREAKLGERKRYYQHRNKERGKMLAKNKNGQPNLATQMEILIGRIKKN